MKIAVTYENGSVFQHFGKSEAFKVYDVQGNEIVSSEVISSNGQGHGALAEVLAAHAIDVLICGGIGQGARDALAAHGITVAAGAEGDTDEAVRAFLSGEFVASNESCAHHHEHHEEEGCGGCHESGSGCHGCHAPEPVTGKNAGHKCTVHYCGTFNDGTQFDSSYDRGQPLEFVCGAGMMIHGFDQAVADMEKGAIVNVHLMPEEAYGLSNPQAILTIPFTELPGSSELSVGEQVVLSDEVGRQFQVLVTAKDDTTITLDANHPMAGKELNFKIELVDVD